MELKGAVAIVTGAARGIGRGIALGLGRAGANVVIADVNAEVKDIVRPGCVTGQIIGAINAGRDVHVAGTITLPASAALILLISFSLICIGGGPICNTINGNDLSSAL